MEPMPDDFDLHQKHGVKVERAPGNIIIYKVLTGRDRRGHKPERSAGVARVAKDAARERIVKVIEQLLRKFSQKSHRYGGGFFAR